MKTLYNTLRKLLREVALSPDPNCQKGFLIKVHNWFTGRMLAKSSKHTPNVTADSEK
jgi:hypothetical protein